MNQLFENIQVLSRGKYLQLPVRITLHDDAIIRSNEPEEVLAWKYESIGERFIIPWRKVKGKLRRMSMEHQRSLGVAPECSLKNNLCMTCPSCLLFGGTGETSTANVKYNLLSRVLGETFVSFKNAVDVSSYTANAVDELDLTTGQALMTIVKVPTETVFTGVVTLRDPTPDLTSILIHNLQRLTRIGASTREWGRCSTEVLGYRLGDREDLSSRDLVENGNAPELKKISSLELPNADEAVIRLAGIVNTLVAKDVKKEKKSKKESSETENENG
jgi:CRISPR type I-D-associated protein Csc2